MDFCAAGQRRGGGLLSKRVPRATRKAGAFVRCRYRCGAFSSMIVALTLVPGLASFARADQIVVGGVNYAGAKVLAFHQGELRFRTADGGLQDAWIGDVDLIAVDRVGPFTDFNQAERFLADGEPGKAIMRYRRTLRLVESFWQDIVTTRLLMAAERAGRIDEAALNFVQVVRGEWAGPAAAARLLPLDLPTARGPDAVRAVEHLEAALAVNPPSDQRTVLTLFRYALLESMGDRRAALDAWPVAKLAIPEAIRCARLYAVQLAALGHAFETVPVAEVLPTLDQAIRDCPDSVLPSFLLLKGRVLLQFAETREDLIRATWPLLQVVAHMPDDARAAEGLYHVAFALERIGRPGKACGLLRECLAHKSLSRETRRAAEAALGSLSLADAGRE